MDTFNMRLATVGLVSAILIGSPLGADARGVSKSEINRAKQMHVQITQSQGVYPDPELNEYVERIGRKMAAVSDMPDLEWTFTILDTNDINAFTTGGGYVYLSRGLMAYLDSEAELAAVLGHEIGHVTGKHPSRQKTQGTIASIASVAAAILTGESAIGDLTNLAGTAIVRGYGRGMELEADELGARYLARAGYDPEAMIRVVATLKEHEMFEKDRARAEGRQARVYHGLFSTHPDNDTRLQEVIASASKESEGATGKDENRDDYLRAIDGMAFASSRAQGMVRGSRFYHANFQMTMAFPTGWNIENRSNELVAVAPDRNHILKVTAQPPPAGVTSAREYARRLLANSRVERSEEQEINGLNAFTAIVRGVESPFGSRSNVRYVIISHQNLMWILVGASRSSNPAPAGDLFFTSAARTFRPLRPNELVEADPFRIRIVKTPEGATMESIAARSPLPKYALEEHRLLNGFYPEGEPQTGEYIKFVR